MNKSVIIIFACLITALLVGFEVYLWQGGLPLPIGNFRGSIVPQANNLNTNFNEIKTKEQGIAVCEQNSAYGKTAKDAEQKQMGLAMADYCYSLIAGKFNDISLCQRAIDKNACEKSANELIDMGKEIQNMSPEEKQQMQNAFKNLYKQQ